MVKWPPREDIEEVLKRLEANPERYGRIVPNDAPPLDLMKRDLCAQFVIYKRENKISQRDLAQKLEIDEALVSKILRYHFDEFTLDRLIRYLAILGIKFELKRVA
jgi:predicted XRE-type DNA-binding protein